MLIIPPRSPSKFKTDKGKFSERRSLKNDFKQPLTAALPHPKRMYLKAPEQDSVEKSLTDISESMDQCTEYKPRQGFISPSHKLFNTKDLLKERIDKYN